MGEMADFSLEGVMEHEELRTAFRTGELSLEDAFELGIIDELGYEYTPGSSYKTCRCCNKGGLFWGAKDKKWRLFEAPGKLHNCPVNPLKEGPQDDQP